MQLCDSFYLKGPKTAKNATTRIPVVSTAHATLMVFAVSITTLLNITPPVHCVVRSVTPSLHVLTSRRHYTFNITPLLHL